MSLAMADCSVVEYIHRVAIFFASLYDNHRLRGRTGLMEKLKARQLQNIRDRLAADINADQVAVDITEAIANLPDPFDQKDKDELFWKLAAACNKSLPSKVDKFIRWQVQDGTEVWRYFSKGLAIAIGSAETSLDAKMQTILDLFSNCTMRKVTEQTFRMMTAMCLVCHPAGDRMDPNDKFNMFKAVKKLWAIKMKTAPDCVGLRNLPMDPSSLAQVRPDLYARLFHPSGIGQMPWPLWKLMQVQESIPMRWNKRKADESGLPPSASSDLLQMGMACRDYIWKAPAEIAMDEARAKYQKQMASDPSLTIPQRYLALKEAAIKANTKAANPGFKGESSTQLASYRCIAKANSYS